MLSRLSRSVAVFISFCVFFVSGLSAQDLTFVKVPLSQSNGLGLIAGMTQDRQGFLWLATHTGLHRYDGYEQVTYINNRYDDNSLGDNRLECVLADRNGYIWIGVWTKGLDRFDPRTGVFTHFRHNPLVPNSLSDDVVTALLEDREGNIWVGTHKGLNLLHPETGTFTRYEHDPSNPGSISDNKVRALYQDRQGAIWVGTGSPWESKPGEGGLNRFDPKTGTFQRFKHDPNNPNTLVSNWVRAIYEDSRGTFWVGTFGDGLHRMNRKTGSVERLPYDPQRLDRLSRPYVDKEKQNDGVNIIHEDHAGAIWIGTYDSGLNRYDPGTGKVKQYQKISAKTTGLDDNNIWTALNTREGTLWFGTANGNLFRTDPERYRIPHIETGSIVRSLYEDPSGYMLIGTSNGLIVRHVKSGRQEQYVHHPDDPNSLGADTVATIYKDSRGEFWLGHASSKIGNGYLSRFNLQTRTFTSYRHDANDPASLSYGSIYAILEDSLQHIWIATGNGLDRLDRESGTFVHYRQDPDDLSTLSHNSIASILEGEKGYLWLGTHHAGGVNYFNTQTGRSKKYLLGKIIWQLYRDAAGVIWAATENAGVYRYDKASDAFLPFPLELNEDAINAMGVVEDNQQNLWFNTRQGLLKIDRQRSNAQLLREPYGVQPGALSFLSAYKGRDGRLYFGNSSGYYAFFPQQWHRNNQPPRITFTGLRLFDEPVVPGPRSLLKAPLSEISGIELKPDQNVFTIDFTGIHFSNPEQNRFLYRLENYDHDWRAARSARTASYYNVPPGHYVFHVRASNNDGVWAEKTLSIYIKPPWWNTWWAYVLYGALLLALVLTFNRLQRQRLVARERYRARGRELEQAREIERAYQELKQTQAKLVQQEKLASLGELTAGIAHEIQNPLNFINNFAEVSAELTDELQQELPAQPEGEAKSIIAMLRQNLEKIIYHGQRADSIVKGMLQHSRSSSGQKELTDLNALTNEYLQLSYHGLRAKNKGFCVTIETSYDKTLEKVAVVPQELGRVLLNLFSNAFYAVQQKQKLAGAGYEPKVEVSTCRREGLVEITVRDNGIGMPEKVKNKIFQPFFTTKPTGSGTGLGLSLSYDIIAKGHGGELRVDTAEGEYTAFTIQLPVTVVSPLQPVVV
ncbi:sensor histidine kinase [Pontibacter russatus]|uniref:sensor histidine kinase n=1 Tax=Pontibacter russatus TaxID=2694929 RepID=UPI001379644F|nr:sensor histidine kinase [Pontibacter russatus]